MIELQRPILLPPPSAALSSQARAAAMGLPVPVVAPVPQAPSRDEREGAALSEWRRAPRADFEDATPARREDRYAGFRRSGFLTGSARTEAGAPRDSLGSLAFLAQQIFQEAMTTGLYLEPWTQGIGAYRRAGAEPLLEGAGPALVSLAV